MFDDWCTQHEPKLRPTGSLTSIVEWGNKLPGQVLRLAGILHVIRTQKLDGTIDVLTMADALALADYFTDHALVVFATMRTDLIVRDAKAVFDWISERGEGELSTRQVATSKDWLADRVRAALALLSEYGWLRQAERTASLGRPSERWAAHPELCGAKRHDTLSEALEARLNDSEAAPEQAIVVPIDDDGFDPDQDYIDYEIGDLENQWDLN
jgi:hypothetical protein